MNNLTLCPAGSSEPPQSQDSELTVIIADITKGTASLCWLYEKACQFLEDGYLEGIDWIMCLTSLVSICKRLPSVRKLFSRKWFSKKGKSDKDKSDDDSG